MPRRATPTTAVLLWLIAAPSVVRGDDTEPRNFSVERFQLAADRNGLFNVDWAEHPGGDAIDAALVVGFADNPLVVSRVGQNNDRMVIGALVGPRTTADLIGSIVLRGDLSLGADLPLVIYQNRSSPHHIAPSGLEAMPSSGLGNLRITPKLTLLTEERNGIGLAVLAAITLPTQSTGDAYFGDHGLSVAPTVALSRRYGEWRMGANLGYLARKQATLLDLRVDDEVFARAGIGYDVPIAPVRIDVTLALATPAAHLGGQLDQLEPLLGATVQIDPQVQLFGAAGAGVGHGFGTPDARIMVGVRLTRGGGGGHASRAEIVPDRSGADRDAGDDDGVSGHDDADGDDDDDGDGIPYELDKCPSLPEDLDGFEDEDGCPDPDNDGDGVLDVADQCPMEPGPAATHGCPDRDSDGDGVVDRLDRCPTEPGSPDDGGCPKPPAAEPDARESIEPPAPEPEPVPEG